MDKNQLTTVVVTAVIAVIAKEVLTWGVAMVKKAAFATTIRAMLRAIFTKINIRIFFDLFTLAVYTYWFIQTAWTDSAITGKDLLIILGCALGFIFVFITLLSHIADAMLASEKLKKSNIT